MKKFYSLLILALFAVNGAMAQSSITPDGTSIVIDLDVATPLGAQYNPDADKYNHVYNIIGTILTDAGFTNEKATWDAVTDVKLTGDAEYSWMDLRAVRNRLLNMVTLDLSETKLVNNKIQGQLAWSGGKYVESGWPATGTGAFAALTQLTTVKFSDNMTIIGKCAFATCSNLTNVDLPSGLVSIETEAFRACTKLTIPNGLPAGMSGSLGNTSFYGCPNLVLTGDFPANLMIASSTQVFENSSKVAFSSIAGRMPTDGSKTKYGTNVFNNTGLTSIVIPEGIYSTDQNSFYNCKNLVEVTFPATMGKNRDKYAPDWQPAISTIGQKAFALPAGSSITRKYIFLAETPPQGGTFAAPSPSTAVSADAFNIGDVVDATSVVLVPNATAVTNFIAVAPFDQMNVRAKINTIDVTVGENGDVSTTYGTIEENKIDAEYGKEITFDIAPKTGFVVDVATLDGEPVTVTNNKVTFTVEGAAARTPGHALVVTFKPDSTVSINDENGDKVVVSYNSGIVTVEGATGVQKEVYNAMGRLIVVTDADSFDLSGYAQGIYFVKIGTQTSKILKK
ncbi:leucine-rich repeat domain-containing protein [Dysgonomonas sp. 520]|uniref:leucine-rich repeat domain-containing protein n=1 Tax=Dysgonomonas sp. 520 TaxID=2302931 RepID=UPI0013D1EA65|nr:leucine-rich repeat domain-containing protein [Dysgonomonas sp. 520]